MNLPSTPSNQWTARYEALRRYFVDERKWLAAEPLSLTLLLQKGLAGWMRAWHSNSPADSTPPTASTCPAWNPPAGPVWQQELTRLIAHMTVQQLNPIAPCS
jgi:hypothetical protein